MWWSVDVRHRVDVADVGPLVDSWCSEVGRDMPIRLVIVAHGQDCFKPGRV